MLRLRLIETALIHSEMDRGLPEGEPTKNPGYRLAFAFRRLVDGSRAIALASRYESRLHRIHERTYRTLRELQQTRREQTAAKPTPAPTQPEPPPPTMAVPGQAQPQKADEKSRNEPTPLTPAAARKDRQPLLIAWHRGFRSINTRRFRLGHRKTA